MVEAQHNASAVALLRCPRGVVARLSQRDSHNVKPRARSLRAKERLWTRQHTYSYSNTYSKIPALNSKPKTNTNLNEIRIRIRIRIRVRLARVDSRIRLRIRIRIRLRMARGDSRTRLRDSSACRREVCDGLGVDCHRCGPADSGCQQGLLAVCWGHGDWSRLGEES
jgi:hypothetical protein